jgi:hypothetical protein
MLIRFGARLPDHDITGIQSGLDSRVTRLLQRPVPGSPISQPNPTSPCPCQALHSDELQERKSAIYPGGARGCTMLSNIPEACRFMSQVAAFSSSIISACLSVLCNKNQGVAPTFLNSYLINPSWQAGLP